MTSEGSHILEHLRRVDEERHRRRAEPALESRVSALKAYQHERFARSYADLRAQPRYARATQFFLDDLYGPRDFSQRDQQFARVVPALVKLFPHEIVVAVSDLAELHALSEALDSSMAHALATTPIDAAAYVRAWQQMGRVADRERQIALMVAVGTALDRLTRNPVLRHSLRLMRGPAKAAGMAALQAFLETGFDTFREMRGAAEFLATIALRERALAAALFAADPRAPDAGIDAALVQLP